MNNIKRIIVGLIICISYFSSAHAEESVLPSGYISEDLFVYMHSGAGNNYRILGTINSGEQVQLTGETNNEYTQIITDKERSGWVESKYVSTKPGLRFVIADLNEKLASDQARNETLLNDVEAAKALITELESEKSSLQNSISALNMDLNETKSQLKNQDIDLKKEWFFTGAIVLGFGLLLGLILPRLFAKRKSSMESWN
jgi:SH3 domain protein